MFLLFLIKEKREFAQKIRPLFQFSASKPLHHVSIDSLKSSESSFSCIGSFCFVDYNNNKE
ncbi:MAG: hypothetical protein C6W58_02020 [Bacillaceae bacterium]|uniref:Uncharacterized protein n=1 Tax=Aeribacillus pallidus TaxID=33936 RepID=A0A164ARY7_9BACI|nr:hypothetical protein A3Q35_08350 [Aeribacillus pallidus]KZN97148.1 hypothetical protein AZI98_06215 [Aeribacillus pallidus]REJ20734.1 MAG: hypothetical protein C6W58_02020 [Bacillaceae bacterium]